MPESVSGQVLLSLTEPSSLLSLRIPGSTLFSGCGRCPAIPLPDLMNFACGYLHLGTHQRLLATAVLVSGASSRTSLKVCATKGPAASTSSSVFSATGVALISTEPVFLLCGPAPSPYRKEGCCSLSTVLLSEPGAGGGGGGGEECFAVAFPLFFSAGNESMSSNFCSSILVLAFFIVSF